MKARDVMSREVVSVGPDAQVPEIARILLEHGISAAPVVGADGAPLGMVSETDLITKDFQGTERQKREARREWWLNHLSEGEDLNPEFLAQLNTLHSKARDVMTSPLVTVEEDADIADIAQLFTTHRIKRVGVVSNGKVTGIVSRFDLLQALAGNGKS